MLFFFEDASLQKHGSFSAAVSNTIYSLSLATFAFFVLDLEVHIRRMPNTLA